MSTDDFLISIEQICKTERLCNLAKTVHLNNSTWNDIITAISESAISENNLEIIMDFQNVPKALHLFYIDHHQSRKSEFIPLKMKFFELYNQRFRVNYHGGIFDFKNEEDFKAYFGLWYSEKLVNELAEMVLAKKEPLIYLIENSVRSTIIIESSFSTLVERSRMVSSMVEGYLNNQPINNRLINEMGKASIVELEVVNNSIKNVGMDAADNIDLDYNVYIEYLLRFLNPALINKIFDKKPSAIELIANNIGMFFHMYDLNRKVFSDYISPLEIALQRYDSPIDIPDSFMDNFLYDHDTLKYFLGMLSPHHIGNEQMASMQERFSDIAVWQDWLQAHNLNQ